MQMYLGDAYTIPASLVGIPALSVPCGVTKGLPIGLQIMAKPEDEHTCFNLASEVETLHCSLPKPTLYAAGERI